MFKVTASTIGQGNPSHAGGGKPYRYRKDPLWTPGCYLQQEDRPAEASLQNAKAMTSRRERLAEYARLRTEEGLTPEEAALRVRAFGRTTRRTYEREFQQQRESQP